MPGNSPSDVLAADGVCAVTTTVATPEDARRLAQAVLQQRLAREAIGRIQVRDSFSLVELPEDGLERLLTKLKDTRVAGKQLKLRRYRED